MKWIFGLIERDIHLMGETEAGLSRGAGSFSGWQGANSANGAFCHVRLIFLLTMVQLNRLLDVKLRLSWHESYITNMT